MILSPSDSELFYKLMWHLQYFVNAQKGIHKNIASVTDYSNLATEKKAKVREALWKNPEMFEAYVQENPHALSANELDILSRWRNRFVKGTFYIFRHLKKGSLFIGDKDKVYMVIGLKTELDEVIPTYALPHMVEAVLLPFKGMLIYDGLLPGYNIIIGGGIRSNLNYAYKVAKEKDRVITTLEPDLASPKPSSLKRNKELQPRLDQLVTDISSLKGDTNLQKAALNLARVSLDLTLATAKSEDIQPHERKIRRAVTRLGNLLEIMEEE